MPWPSSWSSVNTTTGTSLDCACSRVSVSRPRLSGSDRSSTTQSMPPLRIISSPASSRCAYSKWNRGVNDSSCARISRISTMSSGLSSMSSILSGLSSIGLSPRQEHREHAAFARPALGLDRAAATQHDLFADRQAHAAALELAGAVEPLERLEDPLGVGLLEPDAVVLEADLDAAVLETAARDADERRLRLIAEFDRVRDQVLEKLGHVDAVGLQRRQLADLDARACLVNAYLEVGQHVPGDLRQAHGLEFRVLAGDARKAQQVADHHRHAPRRVLDALDVIIGLFVARVLEPRLQELAETEDLLDRLLQIVRGQMREGLELLFLRVGPRELRGLIDQHLFRAPLFGDILGDAQEKRRLTVGVQERDLLRVEITQAPGAGMDGLFGDVDELFAGQHLTVFGLKEIGLVLGEKIVIILADHLAAAVAQQFLGGPVEEHEAELLGVFDEHHVRQALEDRLNTQRF